MIIKYYKSVLLILIFSLMFSTSTIGAAGVAPDLGTASAYGIIGATTTVTGETNVSGSLGSGGATGTAVVSGDTDIANDAYTTAFTNLGTAITIADSLPADSAEVGSDLGGLTLTPGVYKFTGDVTIGSNLTLDGNGVYIFQIDGAFTTAANTQIQLSGGAQACDIFWVANVATIGADSTMEGTVMSKSAVTVGANSLTNGRILAQSSVTANAANTTINVPTACADLPTPEVPEVPEVPEETTVPTPTEPTAVGCESTTVSSEMDSNGNMIIHAVLPNDQKGTGTWNFNLGGKIYTVTGNEDITYTAENAPVGTYEVGAQFIPDDNGDTVDLESCTVSVATTTGGQLPDTATPWYNLLFIGAISSILGIVALMGAAVWNRKKLNA